MYIPPSKSGKSQACFITSSWAEESKTMFLQLWSVVECSRNYFSKGNIDAPRVR